MAATARTRSDAYTGMLIVALLALITGSVLLYLDYDQYPTAKAPQAPSVPAPGKLLGG